MAGTTQQDGISPNQRGDSRSVKRIPSLMKVKTFMKQVTIPFSSVSEALLNSVFTQA